MASDPTPAIAGLDSSSETQEPLGASVYAEAKQEAFRSFLDLRSFWRQRRRILARPELCVSDPSSLPLKPIPFAFQGLFIPQMIVAALVWSAPTVLHRPLVPVVDLERLGAMWSSEEDSLSAQRDSILHTIAFLVRDSARDINLVAQGGHETNSRAYLGGNPAAELAVVKEGLFKYRQRLLNESEILTHAHHVRIAVNAAASLARLKPLGLILLVILPAGLFRRLLRSESTAFPLTKRADRAYIYYGTARTFWPSLFLVVSTSLLALGIRFRMYTLEYADQIGTLIWIGFSAWCFMLLRGNVLGLSKAFAIRGPNGDAQQLASTGMILYAFLVTGLVIGAILFVLSLAVGSSISP